MRTHAEVIQYKPKRSEGYDLCEAMYGAGGCDCRNRGVGPCSSWLYILRCSYAQKLNPIEQEKTRMDIARRQTRKLPQ